MLGGTDGSCGVAALGTDGKVTGADGNVTGADGNVTGADGNVVPEGGTDGNGELACGATCDLAID